MDAVTPTMQELLKRFRAVDWSTRNERAVQDGIEELLQSWGIAYQREPALGPGVRPDFLVGSIAVEVKTASPYSEIVRQLQRYAEHPAITGVLLVTTRTQHARAARIGMLAGKPVAVALLHSGLVA